MTESLDRFVVAQSPIYEQALRELRDEHKESHWMWFIFPQLRGLGKSDKSVHYGLRDLDEARDYLRHPVLGPRLEESTCLVLSSALSAEHIFGEIDAMKFSSCMTLFAAAAGPDSIYAHALKEKTLSDEHTLQILRKHKQ